MADYATTTAEQYIDERPVKNTTTTPPPAPNTTATPGWTGGGTSTTTGFSGGGQQGANPYNVYNPKPPGSPGTPGAQPYTPYTPPPVAPGPTAETEDERKARLLREALAAQMNQPPRDAPQVGAPIPVAPTIPQAAGVMTPERVNNPFITPTTIAPAVTYGAAQVAPTALAVASPVGTARIATSPQDQLRAQQLSLFQGLTAAANGQGPSAAQTQFQRNLDEAIAAQRGQVAANRGTGIVAANLNAATNIANITSKGAADAAALRAKEQADAQQRLAEALQAARTSDIGLATSQAGLEQQSNVVGAQLGTSVSQSNAQIEAARSMKDADLRQAADAGNAAAINELNRRQAELEATRKSTEADLGLKAEQGNQASELAAALQRSKNEQESSVVGATETNKVALENQANVLKASLANAGFTLQGRALDDARNVAAVDAALKAQGQVLTNDIDRQRNELLRQQIAAAVKSGNRDALMKILGTALTVGGAVVGGLIGGPAGVAVGAAAGGTLGNVVSQGGAQGGDTGAATATRSGVDYTVDNTVAVV